MAVPLTTLIYQISHKLPILKVINQSRYGAPPCGEHKVNLVFIDVHPPKYGILGFDLCLLYDGSEMIDFKAVLGWKHGWPLNDQNGHGGFFLCIFKRPMSEQINFAVKNISPNLDHHLLTLAPRNHGYS